MPTATVLRMSRMAKRPSGGKDEKGSTHNGLDGMRTAMQAWPVLTELGNFFFVLPERGSISVTMVLNLHAMWAVWQSRTGV